MKLAWVVPALTLFATPVLAHDRAPTFQRADRSTARADRPTAQPVRAERAQAAQGAPSPQYNTVQNSATIPRAPLCKKGDCAKADHSDAK